MTHRTKKPCHQLGDVMVLEPSAVPLLDSFTPLSHSVATIQFLKVWGCLFEWDDDPERVRENPLE